MGDRHTRPRYPAVSLSCSTAGTGAVFMGCGVTTGGCAWSLPGSACRPRPPAMTMHIRPRFSTVMDETESVGNTVPRQFFSFLRTTSVQRRPSGLKRKKLSRHRTCIPYMHFVLLARTERRFPEYVRCPSASRRLSGATDPEEDRAWSLQGALADRQTPAMTMHGLPSPIQAPRPLPRSPSPSRHHRQE